MTFIPFFPSDFKDKHSWPNHMFARATNMLGLSYMHATNLFKVTH
jgi:hypothetical protein